MRVLYVAQQYDYGDPARGHSFEYYNFYLSLHAMGIDVRVFDYCTEVDKHGRAKANRRLESMVADDKPDLLFGVVRRDLIDPRVMRRISEETSTTTINWFCDDHWQFETHAKVWTPCFNHVVTTSQAALDKYRQHGMSNVIKSQWGANHHLYKPAKGGETYDVTFVGQPYGIRKQAIDALRRAGVNARAWGSGWPAGKLKQPEMIRVFSNSRINLNFADASSSGRTRIEMLAAGHLVSTLRDKPGLWRIWDMAQRVARWDKARSERNATPPPRQIKGRVFEVPACGGLLMSQPAENLADYLEPGKQCVCFESIDELIDKVRYYLANEDERRAIADAGHKRTLLEHTYGARFRDIFTQAGLAPNTPTHRLAA